MPTEKILRQCGLWDSPISPLSVARGLSFSDVLWDSDGTLAWREVRSGWGAIVLQGPGMNAPRDLNSDISSRAKVGYGGGDFILDHGQIYFVAEASGRLYRQPVAGGSARPITPEFGSCASPTPSPDGRWLIFVHTCEGQDSLGIVDSEGKDWPQKLVSGDDFYMQPVWHPGGRQIAWVSWNHPNMPWDGTALFLGELDFPENSLPRLRRSDAIAGGATVSIFQPLFSPDGRHLAYVSDAEGWWQIYLYDLVEKSHRKLTAADADHGRPAWVQGLRTYGFEPAGKSLVFIRSQLGSASLWSVDIASGEENRLEPGKEYAWLEQIAVAPEYTPEGRVQVALIVSGPATPPRVIAASFVKEQDDRLRPAAEVRILRRASAEDVPSEAYAPVEPVTWQGFDGEPVHGLFYPPHNHAFSPKGRPPLIVSIHGGPTSQARAAFNPGNQFFATRGYAVLEVNYRGSTGYGRAYWEALKGQWGIYDVQDAIRGARYLVEQGSVDGDRLVIMGGSAGGFTVLQSLVDHPGFYTAGVCLYGVANQFTLVAETHKFEARYSDQLLGPLPEAAEKYRSRSPVFFADQIRDPVILFQGEDDRVVPRAQSDEIVASLRRRGVPHEYHLYPGEGHGFRKVETIEHFYKAVDRFLRQHVIFA